VSLTFQERVASLVDSDPSTSLLDELFYLKTSFKHASGLYENMVAGVAGNPVHVDMILRRETPDGGDSWVGNNFSYTSFMGEKFSMRALPPEGFPADEQRTALNIPLTKEEFYSVQQYLMGLVDRVEYNYADLGLLSSAVPKGIFVRTMFEEVDGFEDPANVKKVFCSQAVVLVIKACLRGRGWFDNECSRAVSPCRLYHLLKDKLGDCQ
jgi:hypothetical protein